VRGSYLSTGSNSSTKKKNNWQFKCGRKVGLEQCFNFRCFTFCHLLADSGYKNERERQSYIHTYKHEIDEVRIQSCAKMFLCILTFSVKYNRKKERVRDRKSEFMNAFVPVFLKSKRNCNIANETLTVSYNSLYQFSHKSQLKILSK
jgi:hypothetical protein